MGVYQVRSAKPIICLKVTGRLTKTELSQMQVAAIAGIKDWGKVSALVILEDFIGWEKGSGWEDISLADEHEQKIEKMAIVGPDQWRDWVCAFVGRGFRPMAIEYFLPSQLRQARNWLSIDKPSSQ